MVRRVGRVDDRGASAVEYALIVIAVAAVLVPVVFALHERVSSALFGTCVTATKAEAPDTVTDAAAQAQCKALPGPVGDAP
jgi:Flp pilus assembly pilin Flp